MDEQPLEDRPFPPQNLLLLAVVFEGGLGLLAVGLGHILGKPPLETYQATAAAVFWGAAASLPLVFLLWLMVRWPFWPFRDLLRVIDQLVAPIFRHSSVLEMAVIALIAGVGEEMLFRGVIQGSLADWIGAPTGVWIAMVLASLLFGLAHSLTVSYFLVATLMGMYLGWLWIDSGNLLVPIAAHALYDFLALVYLAKIRPRRQGGLDRRAGQS